MATRSRRKAREAALRALYEIEVGGGWPEDVVREAAEHAELDDTLRAYLDTLVWGVQRERNALDAALAPILRGYDLARLATVDRNVLRIAAYELSFEPSVPPAVTINEAVDIVKKYSTAESGKFVNGVLAKYLSECPKANWDPAGAHSEGIESPAKEPETEITTEQVAEDSPEVAEGRRYGAWTIRAE
jgi:N utilization substance protein B